MSDGPSIGPEGDMFRVGEAGVNRTPASNRSSLTDAGSPQAKTPDDSRVRRGLRLARAALAGLSQPKKTAPDEVVDRALAKLRENRPQSKEQSQIKDIISSEGVGDSIREFVDEFDQQPGESRLPLSMTNNGLVVGVREGCIDDPNERGYIRIWTADASVPAGMINDTRLVTDFAISEIGRLKDGGTTIVPSHEISDRVVQYASLTEDEILNQVPESDRQFALFYKRTGGVLIPSRYRLPGESPRAGGKTLYVIS